MALEVGGLAAEIVETVCSRLFPIHIIRLTLLQQLADHLGPFLSELLRAVAVRLSVATTTPMIQVCSYLDTI